MDFNFTLGALLAFLATTGVPAVVGYIVAQLDFIPEAWAKAISAVAIAVGVAFVNSVAGQLPPELLSQPILQVVIYVIAAVLGLGGTLFGVKHGEFGLAERLASAQEIKELKALKK